MMGGGFGGSVIALASEKAAAGLEGAVAPEYEDRTSLKPWFYVCETADAAGEAEL
jgi:galactokinase